LFTHDSFVVHTVWW